MQLLQEATRLFVVREFRKGGSRSTRGLQGARAAQYSANAVLLAVSEVPPPLLGTPDNIVAPTRWTRSDQIASTIAFSVIDGLIAA